MPTLLLPKFTGGVPLLYIWRLATAQNRDYEWSAQRVRSPDI